MNVFELFATLGLDSTAYDEGLTSAESKGQSFASSLGSAMVTGSKIAVGALAATTAATIAGTKAFIDGVSSVSEYGDRIDKMSQKMNMSAESFQEWDFVMEHCGTSIESMQASIKTLSNAAETGNEAFQQLGMTQEQIASMSGEELFNSTITALQSVEDETQRTYLAGQLLGRGATELGPLLNMTAEETAAMRQEVHELGGVMSDEAVASAAGFHDSLQNMQTALTGVKNNLLSEFLPSFSTVMDGLAAVFAGDDSGLGMVDEGVNNFIEKMNEIAPQAMEVGSRILISLVSAISTNLPKLIESGQSVISELISGILQNLPALLQSAVMLIKVIGSQLLQSLPELTRVALELLMYLANGLTESLPTLIPAIVSIVSEIVTILTEPDTLSMLISAALDLILALAEGLAAATPELIALIPQIYTSCLQTMIEMFPQIIETAVMLLGELGVAIWGAIAGLMGTSLEEAMAGWQALGDALKDWINKVISSITNFFTNCVSKVTSFISSVKTFFSNGFTNIKQTVTSILNSIKEKFTSIFDGVKSTVENAINFIKGLFDFEWSLPDLKLPHFTVEGSLDLLATPPKIPKLSVDWYEKAYSDAYILNGATIFGSQGGRLLGGGEGNGGEVVVGTDKLVSMMSQAVKEAIGSGQTFIIPVYIGNEKIDELVVKSNQRQNYISGGR